MLENIPCSMKDILSYKNSYGSIYYIKIKNNQYIFRLLSRKEYLDLIGLQNTIESIKNSIDDYVLNSCLLYPEYDKNNIDNRPAGEIEYIFKNIIEMSGFSSGDKLLKDIEEERNTISILDNQIILLICKAFPHLTLQAIDNMDYRTLLKYIALSEAVLDVKLDISKTKTQGKIDFEEDNRELNDKVIPRIHKSVNKRGDVSK